MPEDRESRIAALFQSYRDSLPPAVLELESLWAQLEKGWDIEVAAEFDRKAHNLAGSAATFDLVEVGSTARELENTFKPLLESEYNRSDARWPDSQQLLVSLREMIDALSA